ncbi:MAG: 16S rRNA (cytosine(1402)-N(4))-methyltransferase RsmH [Patescibacteria group bacterium]
MNKFHVPVLLEEAIEFLQVKKNEKYIDATLGGGGHTGEILDRGGIVLGIDVDEEALDYVEKNFKFQISNFKLTLIKDNFRNIEKIAHLNNFEGVSGILFDLGVSSYQIDTAERGFSFLKEGPLDMRMDKDLGVTAETLVNVLTKGELYDLFNKLGQEHRAFAISKGIVKSRRVKAIQKTTELSGIIEKAYGIRGDASDFTKNLVNKRVFQALRIAVNEELENLEMALPKAIYLLRGKARIVVISFHSLEDRIVKRIFKDFEKKNMGRMITEKPVTPTKKELEENSRAGSAKLRVFEKN